MITPRATSIPVSELPGNYDRELIDTVVEIVVRYTPTRFGGPVNYFLAEILYAIRLINAEGGLGLVSQVINEEGRVVRVPRVRISKTNKAAQVFRKEFPAGHRFWNYVELL